MAPDNTYMNLATTVYDLDKPYPLAEAYAFYKQYLSESNGKILEPMCGTGRFLIPFLNDGHDIEGFDISSSMIKKLKETAIKNNLEASVKISDFDNFVTHEKYSLIFIPSGSFGLFTNESIAMHCLEKIRDWLDHEGKVVFEVETLKAKPTEIGRWFSKMYIVNQNEKIMTSYFNQPVINDIVSVICKYEHIDNGKLTSTEIEEISFKLYDPIKLLKTLQKIGFSKTKLIKAYNRREEAKEEDQMVVFECIK